MSFLNIWMLGMCAMLVIVLVIEILSISQGKSKFNNNEVSFVIAILSGPLGVLISLIILVLYKMGKIKVTL